MTYNPYQQSSAPYGAGSHYPTKPTVTPTPPGYAPGATQSTISQPGPGVISANNPLLISLGKGLANLRQALSSWNTSLSSGAGYSGGGAQPTSLSQPSSWGYSAPTPPTISEPTTYIGEATQQSFAKPVSGLSSEIISDEDKKKKYNLLQKQVSSEAATGVPTRTSLLDKLKGLITQRPVNPLTATIRTTTGTTAPPTEQQWRPSPYGGSMQVSPAFEQYLSEQAGKAPTLEAAPTVDTTPPPTDIGEKPATPTLSANADTTVWGPEQQKVLDSIKSLENASAQLSLQAAKIQTEIAKAALEPGWTAEQAAEMYKPVVAQAQAMYPQFEHLQSNISAIDKVLLDASIGFRKSAEALRNNPDLSMWQQTRRLKELDDMQNYAPIFNGLSMRDLITYRNQLAENMNYYSGLISDATKGIAGLTDFSTPYERMVKSAGALSDVGTWTTSAIDAMKGLAGLLIPSYITKYETNNATGEVTKITYRVDPITKQETEAGRESLGTIGQRTVRDTTAPSGVPTQQDFVVAFQPFKDAGYTREDVERQYRAENKIPEDESLPTVVAQALDSVFGAAEKKKGFLGLW